MKIRTQMLITLIVGLTLTVVIQMLASPHDSGIILRLLIFEGIIVLPILIAIHRVLSGARS